MSAVSANYAEALYDLCREQSITEKALDELKALKCAFEAEERFELLLSSAEISHQEKRGILDACFRGQLSALVLNCLKLMCDKGHLRMFGDMCTRFENIYNTEHGILPVKITSAIELDDVQKMHIQQKFALISGKTAVLSFAVDRSLIGGIRAEYEDRLVDDSIKGRLEDFCSLVRNTKV